MLFDAFERAAVVSQEVEDSGRRRVLRVAAAGACDDAPTIHLPGCNLACVHCWAGPDREAPDAWGAFRTWPALRRELSRYRSHNRLDANPEHIRLSGGEPILSGAFFDLLEALLVLPGKVFVETNGIMLGKNPDWIRNLDACRDRVFFKISLKAGTPERFEQITGATRTAFEASWSCVRELWQAQVPFDLNALSLAEELFDRKERETLLDRLASIAPELPARLTQERLTAYPDTIRRMKAWKA